MTLARSPLMELTLQRYSWLGPLVAAVMGAYLAARTVNTVAAAAIAPSPSLHAVPLSPSQAQPIAHAELDPPRIAKLFGVPLPEPKAPGEPTANDERNQPAWSDVPARSSLHAVLVGTALASPSAYSLCQLTNTDQNE